MIMRIFVAVFFSLFFVCCQFTSPTYVNTKPSGAKIFVDGKYFGKTPTTISPGLNSIIRLERKGYVAAEFEFVHTRTGRIDFDLEKEEGE